MFDHAPATTSLLVFSNPAGNSHAFDAAIAEAARRGVRRESVLLLGADAQSRAILTEAGVRIAPASLTLNGCKLKFLADGAAHRVFASSPARIVASELAASEADVVIAAGALPFTLIADGKAWHSCGPLAQPANDGTPRVWCSVIEPGRDPGSLVFQHVALDYNHTAAAQTLQEANQADEAQELVAGRWRSVALLPKDEARATGIALSPERIFFAKGGDDFRWPVVSKSQALAPQKFNDPTLTANGERRARVELSSLRSLCVLVSSLISRPPSLCITKQGV